MKNNNYTIQQTLIPYIMKTNLYTLAKGISLTISSVRRLATAITALLLCSYAMAYDFEYDGIVYSFVDDERTTCEVARYSVYSSTNSEYYTGEITVPSTVYYEDDELTVVGIGNRAFYYCTDLAHVTIPETVTYIDPWAFYHCTSLEEIVLPEGLLSINSSAFYDCTGLQQVTIPNKVTNIEQWAFSGCTGLTKVVIDDSAEALQCSTSQNNSCFSNTAIEELYIGRDCVSSNDYYPVFSNLSSLTTVVVGDYVTTIEAKAFYECSGLTSVTLPNSVTAIDTYTFFSCSSLAEVTLGDSITTIGNAAFYSCSALESVTLPNTLETIGTEAFYRCSSLTELTIPASVTAIASEAFTGCTGITALTIEDSDEPLSLATGYRAQFIQSPLETLYIGRDYTSSNSTYNAFGGITTLQEVTFSDYVTSIEYGAFKSCTALAKVNFSNSIETIDDTAFYGCTALTEVNLGSGLTTIGQSVFYNCTALERVTLPEGLTEIGRNAFVNCTALEEITIPEGITVVESGTFRACMALEKLTLPETVTNIDEMAFYQCYALEKIYSFNPEPPVCDSYAFYGVDKTECTVYVPYGSYDAYATADTWKDFFNIVEFDPAGISAVDTSSATIAGYYTLDGKALAAPQKGINVVRYTNGTTAKILCK